VPEIVIRKPRRKRPPFAIPRYRLEDSSILNIQVLILWTGFMWLRVGVDGRLL
jgi:hypothetical protein